MKRKKKATKKLALVETKTHFDNFKHQTKHFATLQCLFLHFLLKKTTRAYVYTHAPPFLSLV